MKKLFLILLATLFALALYAEQPALVFTHNKHDFGRLPNRGGEVSQAFDFRNDGKAPLVITRIDTSCECTHAKFDPKPVMPGETGKIIVTYDPKHQNGTFYKAIQVFSNDPAGRQIITVQGEVYKGK